jgi:hypothetical protein
MINKNLIQNNIDALFYLFSNEKIYKEILNTSELAGNYKRNNKEYCYKYNNIIFNNIDFYNMFKRPVSFLNNIKPLCNPSCCIRNYQNKCCEYSSCIPNNKYYKCNPNYIQYEFKSNDINDPEISYLMLYAISNYYFKRILNEIKKCRNMLERPGTEYFATIKIPKEYFPSIKQNEIYKVYKPKQLLNIYYYVITGNNNFYSI